MAANLGARYRADDEDVMVDINTTPLIDVMLVLLIMLIVTVPIQTHAVKLALPTASAAAPPAPPKIVTIDVDFDGSVLWNGAALAGRDALEARLRAAAREPVQPEIRLRPNKLARYESVVAVMAAVRRLGLTRLGIVGGAPRAN